MKADREATRERHFADRRSYVAKDRREVLYGKDWAERKKELWTRCKGRCEALSDIIDGSGEVVFTMGCPEQADDPHHVIPRSKGRDDRLSNLQALCRYHHDLLDKRKVRWTKHARD